MRDYEKRWAAMELDALLDEFGELAASGSDIAHTDLALLRIFILKNYWRRGDMDYGVPG
jgi:hypothetical protein